MPVWQTGSQQKTCPADKKMLKDSETAADKKKEHGSTPHRRHTGSRLETGAHRDEVKSTAL
jgi:hypothetical protein